MDKQNDAVIALTLAGALARDWGVSIAGANVTGRDSLLDALTERVRQLLRNDFQKLVTAMYTLDVSEARFREAMAGEEAAAARQIAELILSREIEKAESRAKHSAHLRSAREPDEQTPLPEKSR